MIQVLLVVQVLISCALIGIILLQRSDTDGFGLGSGSGSNFMTGRAQANLLTRITAILATLFILNSLALGILAAHGRAPSIADTIIEQEESTVPQVPVAGEDENKALGAEATEKVIAPAAQPVKKKAPKKVETTDEATPSVPAAE